MHWTQFILDLMDKLLWPAALVAALFVLRKPLSQLIPNARKIKFKDIEVEFGQDLDSVEKNAAQAFPEIKESRRSIIMSSVNTMPNNAVLEAWGAVDEAAEALIKMFDQKVNLNVKERYKLIENTLLEQKLVDVKKGKLFSELRQLRNKVAHASRFEVGKAEASRYVDLCFRLVAHFEYLLDLMASNR